MKQLIIMLFTLISGVAAAQNIGKKFTSQNNDDFARTIADKEVQLIDVRTPLEYALGHIPTAINMDVSGADFDKQTETLAKARPVAIYCRSGVRSKTAARRLTKKGYTVYELDQGISNWNGKIEK